MFRVKTFRCNVSLLNMFVTALFTSVVSFKHVHAWLFNFMSSLLFSTQDKGVKVIAVGVGNKIRKEELVKIAMDKEENVLRVTDFQNLFDKLQTIIDSSCQM